MGGPATEAVEVLLDRHQSLPGLPICLVVGGRRASKNTVSLPDDDFPSLAWDNDEHESPHSLPTQEVTDDPTASLSKSLTHREMRLTRKGLVRSLSFKSDLSSFCHAPTMDPMKEQEPRPELLDLSPTQLTQHTNSLYILPPSPGLDANRMIHKFD
jgi:hypothetical protein